MRSDVRNYAMDLERVLNTISVSATASDAGADARAPAHGPGIAASAAQATDLLHKLTDAATVAESGSDSAYERDLGYLERIHPRVDEVLAEVERHGRDAGVPIVDRETGRLLSVMTSCMLASEILEIGTAIGYSTLWLARSMPETGHLITIDPDRERTALATSFFERACVSERIEVVNQPALAVLPTLPKRHYDIIFIDAVKEEYSAYLELAVPLLKKSGLVMADNLLWAHAASKAPAAEDAPTTVGLRRFNERFLTHPDLNATILPVGDGLGIGAKIT